MSTAASISVRVEGTVSAGFEAVRDAFAENFTRRHELGGACAAWHQGRKVVDLWGGVRNKDTGAPWERDTMVIVYSTTKGLAAMVMALAHSRGWLDYGERVSTYWPEFAARSRAWRRLMGKTELAAEDVRRFIGLRSDGPDEDLTSWTARQVDEACRTWASEFRASQEAGD